MTELIYEIEEVNRRDTTRYYVWYIEPGRMTQTVFDVCATRIEAEQAIDLHKHGEHPTQYTY